MCIYNFTVNKKYQNTKNINTKKYYSYIKPKMQQSYVYAKSEVK